MSKLSQPDPLSANDRLSPIATAYYNLLSLPFYRSANEIFCFPTTLFSQHSDDIRVHRNYCPPILARGYPCTNPQVSHQPLP